MSRPCVPFPSNIGLEKWDFGVCFRHLIGHFATQPLPNEVGVLKFATLKCAPSTGKSIETGASRMSFDTFKAENGYFLCSNWPSSPYRSR